MAANVASTNLAINTASNAASKRHQLIRHQIRQGVLGDSSPTAREARGVSCANCLSIYMPDSFFCRKCGVAGPTGPQEPDEHSSSTIEMGNPIEQFDIDVKPDNTSTNNTTNSSARNAQLGV